MTDWQKIAAESLASGYLTDEFASAAVAVATGYIRRQGERIMHNWAVDEFQSKFALRLCSHWRQAAAARNPHAYLSRMAQNALRDSRREEFRHSRISFAILAARASGARV